MLKISFEVTGEKQINRAFDAAAKAFEDFTPVFKELGKRFQSYEKQMFDTEGGISGSRWATLSPGYRAWKSINYPGKGILERKGTLKKSLTSPQAVHELEKLSAAYGTTVPYAIYHQKGAGNMPARKPIKLSKKERHNWTRELHRYIKSVIEKRITA